MISPEIVIYGITLVYINTFHLDIFFTIFDIIINT